MQPEGRERAKLESELEPQGIPTGAFRFYLHPGNLFVTGEETLVTTVLGSCVSLCLWDARTGVGGMNHFLLPQGSADDTRRDSYGNVANMRLLQGLLELGAARPALKAKLFGGARLSSTPKGAELDLGIKNVCAAEVFLRSQGIPLVSADVKGDRGRKLLFRTRDGAAWVRKL